MDIRTLVCNKKGRVYDLDCQPALMKSGIFFKADPKDLIELPGSSSLFMLAQRPAVYMLADSSPAVLGKDMCGNEEVFAVAAFLPPGFTLTYNAAFFERKCLSMLPLFAYAPVVFFKNKMFTTALKVDLEKRQDESLMDPGLIRKNIKEFKKYFVRNRLFSHMINCAVVNNCPAAKNFFLNRYEAPLVSSTSCNALCVGCISFQGKSGCPVTQPRIRFKPTAEELSSIALFHINRTNDPVVSFGQGCEGEPLLSSDTISKAIKMIRKNSKKGIINLNTNASLPQELQMLCDSGLDSVRISLNSARKNYYHAYYRPRGYDFSDVLRSLKVAGEKGIFVSLNYLVMPGFSDDTLEANAFKGLLSNYKINMIQWRNLNFDPLRYPKVLKFEPEKNRIMGMDKLIRSIKKDFPHIMHGYFNPSKNRIRRFFK